jgi:hypothetical protein
MKLSAKMTAALVAGVLFFILSNPIVYKFTDGLLGGIVGPLASNGGSPTTTGLILHSAVFVAATYYGVGL